MFCRSFYCFLFVFVVWTQAKTTPLVAQDLINPPEGFVKYKLSNVRTERGIGTEVIAFDYKRTREGKGQVILAARTDNGPVRISGFGARIEQTGTIRLRDLFSNLRGVLGSSDGIEFYFVAVEGSSFIPSGKRYLVSNSVKHGTMNSKVVSRPLNKKELEAIERDRLLRTPPATVPNGYKRTSNDTVLVPGAPVMVGSMGKWKEATVARITNDRMVKVLETGSKLLRSVKRDKWIAITSETERKISQDPKQFSINIRTLPDGNLILDDDLEPITDGMSLVKGTPLRFEKYSSWQDGFFLSSDNVSVHMATTKYGRTKREMIPLKQVAIRKQTLQDLKRDNAEEMFAANLANLPKVESQAGMSRGSGSLDSGTASFPEPAGFPEPSGSAASTKVKPDEVERTWTDKSGKFKIEATLTKKTATAVFLKRADGSVVQVPIDRLSESDQKHLAGPEPNTNPFENVIMSGSPGSSSAPASSSALEPQNYRDLMKPVTRITDLTWGAKAVAISPDNKYVLIGRAAQSASLCEIKTGKMLVDSGRMPHMGDVTQVGFTPNNRYAVLGGYKGVIDVYTFSNGKLKLAKQYAGHTKEITAMALSSDSRHALTGDRDKNVRYWELSTGDTIATITGLKRAVQATHVSDDGYTLMATDGKKLIVYDLASKSIRREQELIRGIGQSAAFSPNGLLLSTGDGYKLRLFNLQTFAEMPVMDGESIAWTSTFAPDSRHLMTGHNGVINIWDTKTQSRVLSQPIGESFYIKSIGISADGTHVGCPSDHSSVTVLQTAK